MVAVYGGTSIRVWSVMALRVCMYNGAKDFKNEEDSSDDGEGS